MRVQNPLTYGEKLMSLALTRTSTTAEASFEKMFGGSEININFPKNIWVHLTYQTAFVDEDGKLQLREDVYGWDQRMIQILKGSERKVADIGIERAPNSSSKPVQDAGRHVRRQHAATAADRTSSTSCSAAARRSSPHRDLAAATSSAPRAARAASASANASNA